MMRLTNKTASEDASNGTGAEIVIAGAATAAFARHTRLQRAESYGTEVANKGRKMTQSVFVAALLHVKAGKEEEIEARLRELVQASRLDEGVLSYDLYQSIDDPTLWFLYEQYESPEHLNKHKENPVLRSFLADAPTLVNGSIDIRTFRMISDPAGA